jgi:ubiquinone biosynthesis protein COQ9
MGARDMGFLDVSIQLFTRQEMDLILYWLASRRGLLRAKVQNGLFEGKQVSVDEKIKTLVIERLRMNGPIIHRWQDVSSISGRCFLGYR